MGTFRTRLLAVAAATTLALSGCGGDDSDSGDSGGKGGNPPAVTTTPTVSKTGQTNPTTSSTRTATTRPTTTRPTTTRPTIQPTTTRPAATPNLVTTDVTISNSLGQSTTCYLKASIHNNSNFEAASIRVEATVAGQAAPKFTAGMRLNGPATMPAFGEREYGNLIPTVVPAGDPLKVTVLIYADGRLIRTDPVPNFMYCKY